MGTQVRYEIIVVNSHSKRDGARVYSPTQSSHASRVCGITLIRDDPTTSTGLRGTTVTFEP